MKVNITINNQKVSVEETLTVLQACEEVGIQVPRFCYHDRLSIAGNCRMCLVQVAKAAKPVASCAVRVGEGMSIYTDTDLTRKAREGVMEFLLANHPLDCPICDQGGECDLQDQAMLFGNDRGRFYEQKRAVSDKNLGPLIKTIMTRCIHCTRCVRFSAELTGEQEIGITGRGNKAEIGTYIEKPLVSEIAGNIIDLCPVGALTSKPYAFTARSWELRRTETIDTLDSMCSNVGVYTNEKKIMRILPIVHEGINEEWLSDRTRFSYDGVRLQRIVYPAEKTKKGFVKKSWKKIFESLSLELGLFGRSSIIVGGNLSVEGGFGLRELSKVLDCNNLLLENGVVHRMNDFRHFYSFNKGYASIESSDGIIFMGCNPQKEIPLLLVRIRKEQKKRTFFVGSFGSNAFKGISYVNGGNTFGAIFSFLEGRNFLCQHAIKLKRPMLLIGSAILESKYVNSIIKGVFLHLKRFRLPRNSLCIVDKCLSHVSLLEIGTRRNKIVNTKRNLLVKTDSVIRRKKNGIFALQSTHGNKGTLGMDIVLAGTTPFECDSIYISGEGRSQFSKCILRGIEDTRVDYKIDLALSTYVQDCFVGKQNLKEVRESVDECSGLIINGVLLSSFFILTKSVERYRKTSLLIDSYSNYYRGSGYSMYSAALNAAVIGRPLSLTNTNYCKI